MFTKNKDESWAAGLFGGTDCRMQRTATVLGRRKEEFFLIFFFNEHMSVLIKHPFVFKQTLEWMKWPFPHEERWTLTRLVKNDCCILRIRCQCFDTIASTLDGRCKSNWVWTHWEPVCSHRESLCASAPVNGLRTCPTWSSDTNHATDFYPKGYLGLLLPHPLPWVLLSPQGMFPFYTWVVLEISWYQTGKISQPKQA